MVHATESQVDEGMLRVKSLMCGEANLYHDMHQKHCTIAMLEQCSTDISAEGLDIVLTTISKVAIQKKTANDILLQAQKKRFSLIPVLPFNLEDPLDAQTKAQFTEYLRTIGIKIDKTDPKTEKQVQKNIGSFNNVWCFLLKNWSKIVSKTIPRRDGKPNQLLEALFLCHME